jgi:hypothetical protein
LKFDQRACLFCNIIKKDKPSFTSQINKSKKARKNGSNGRIQNKFGPLLCIQGALQQRSKRESLVKMGATQTQIAAMIKWLKDENYLDDARFAQAFARGKFRVNYWGKYRIINELQQRDISSNRHIKSFGRNSGERVSIRSRKTFTQKMERN